MTACTARVSETTREVCGWLAVQGRRKLAGVASACCSHRLVVVTLHGDRHLHAACWHLACKRQAANEVGHEDGSHCLPFVSLSLPYNSVACGDIWTKPAYCIAGLTKKFVACTYQP